MVLQSCQRSGNQSEINYEILIWISDFEKNIIFVLDLLWMPKGVKGDNINSYYGQKNSILEATWLKISVCYPILICFTTAKNMLR